LTDRKPSFKEIGRLRKGAPKDQGLQDLKYFRPDFRPDEAQAYARFVDAYGTTPTRINIRLAFDDIERCWECYFMVYNTAGLMGKAGIVPGREGWWWIYFRNPKTGELSVKDAEPATPFDPKLPVYSYVARSGKNAGKDIPVFARPEGRLKVLIPELRLINYVTLMTHSWYDCARIEEQLIGIQEVGKRMGMSLPMVPLVLTRRPENVSIAFDGHKKIEEKWLINIDVRPDWAEAQFLALESFQPGAALPAGERLPALPAGVPDRGWNDDEDEAGDQDLQGMPSMPEDPPMDNHLETQAQQPVQQPPQQPAQQPKNGNGNGRPYPPEKIRQGIQEAANRHAGKSASDKQRSLIAMLLDEVFQGDEDKRHTLQVYLTGSKSLKDTRGPLLLALLDWLKPTEDSGGAYTVGPYVEGEAQGIVTAALKAEGQTTLF